MNENFQRARDNHPGERRYDRGARQPGRLRTAYLLVHRYVLPSTAWSFLASLIAVWAVVLHYGDQGKIISGRQSAIAVTCGATNGVIVAGRQIVLGATNPNVPVSRFERNLEALGYPPRRVRRAQAVKAANDYAAQIRASVQRQVDGNAKEIVRPDGTLDCAVFERVARAR